VVFKPMRRRAVAKALSKAGCVKLRDTGGHTTSLPRHITVSGGVVKSIGDQMACLPKGWLQ
jgi:hypothetical protein